MIYAALISLLYCLCNAFSCNQLNPYRTLQKKKNKFIRHMVNESVHKSKHQSLKSFSKAEPISSKTMIPDAAKKCFPKQHDNAHSDPSRSSKPPILSNERVVPEKTPIQPAQKEKKTPPYHSGSTTGTIRPPIPSKPSLPPKPNKNSRTYDDGSSKTGKIPLAPPLPTKDQLNHTIRKQSPLAHAANDSSTKTPVQDKLTIPSNPNKNNAKNHENTDFMKDLKNRLVQIRKSHSGDDSDNDNDFDIFKSEPCRNEQQKHHSISQSDTKTGVRNIDANNNPSAPPLPPPLPKAPPTTYINNISNKGLQKPKRKHDNSGESMSSPPPKQLITELQEKLKKWEEARNQSNYNSNLEREEKIKADPLISLT